MARYLVENPGTGGSKMAARKKAKKRNPSKKPAAKKRNPKRSAAKRAPSKRTNPGKVRTAKRRANPAKRRPAKRRANPGKPRAAKRRTSRRRTRRNNPGWSNATVGLMALAAGTGAALVSSWINDAPLGNQRPMTQNGALLVEGAAAVYFIENPAILGGVLVGLFLVPIARFVYSQAPNLANPRPMGSGAVLVMSDAAPAPAMTPAAPPAVVVVSTDASGNPVTAPAPDATAPTLNALHRGNLARLRGADQAWPRSTMGALHRGGMGALHQSGGLRALHRGGMGALHRGMSALTDGNGETVYVPPPPARMQSRLR